MYSYRRTNSQNLLACLVHYLALGLAVHGNRCNFAIDWLCLCTADVFDIAKIHWPSSWKSQHFIVLGWFICHFPLFKFSVQTTYSLPPEYKGVWVVLTPKYCHKFDRVYTEQYHYDTKLESLDTLWIYFLNLPLWLVDVNTLLYKLGQTLDSFD